MPKSKAPRKSKAQSKAQPAPEAAPAPAPAPVVEATVVEAEAVNAVVETEWSMGTEFTNLLNTINGLRSQLTRLSSDVRDLHRRSEKELKAATKAQRKRKAKNSNRKPSGFVKPTPITDELASFLGKETGSLMARTEVTREINQYIREHKLQNPKNGRHILPDKALGKLLRVGPKDELTYFNLQKYMSPHFIKTATA